MQRISPEIIPPKISRIFMSGEEPTLRSGDEPGDLPGDLPGEEPTLRSEDEPGDVPGDVPFI